MKHSFARWVICLGLLQLWALGARGIGVEAGTAISNTAEVSFELAGTPVTRNSNTAVVTVAEVLDVDVLLAKPDSDCSSGRYGPGPSIHHYEHGQWPGGLYP